jgi:hypothetical protein
MPSFLRKNIFLNSIFWLICIAYLGMVSPDDFFRIAIFLGLFFVSVSLSFSFVCFSNLRKRIDRTGDRLVYKKSLRWGAFIGFLTTGSLGFAALDLINFVNYGLFLLFCLGIYFWLKSLR